MRTHKFSPTLICLLVLLLSLSMASCRTTTTETPAPTALLAPVSQPIASQAPAAEPAAYWPTQGWRSSAPEEQGMDGQKLSAMLDEIQQMKFSLDSLLVIRHGYIVSENYFSFYQAETTHELYSCTKSFVSTLVGIAMDQGLIDRLDHPALDLLPAAEYKNLDPAKNRMTLENLLTMTSGLDWDEGDTTYRDMYNYSDWVRYVLDLPIKNEPGSSFLYCSGCSHVLSAIVQNKSGQNTEEFAKQYLFAPLGITHYRWNTSGNGIPIGGWGLQLAPRDMAKLGYLFLHNGNWDGQQVVSPVWVAEATRAHIIAEADRDYGYQWWIIPELKAYTALGRFGQTILVVPSADLVVVTTAEDVNHDDIFRMVKNYILPSIKE